MDLQGYRMLKYICCNPRSFSTGLAGRWVKRLSWSPWDDLGWSWFNFTRDPRPAGPEAPCFVSEFFRGSFRPVLAENSHFHSFSICQKSETFHETSIPSKFEGSKAVQSYFKTLADKSELLCAPRHAKPSALLGPRPWHRHVTLAALAVERQKTSLLTQGTHRLPSEFLWIWYSDIASKWGKSVNQNKSIFVSQKGKGCMVKTHSLHFISTSSSGCFHIQNVTEGDFW